MTLHTQKKIKFNLIPIAFLLLFGFSIQAQDKKAKDLLGEVTSKVKSYENITIDFKYSLIFFLYIFGSATKPAKTSEIAPLSFKIIKSIA